MPRQALITLNHIKEATAILTASGQSVTNRSLREIIGFGSFDTIGKLRKQLEALPTSSTDNTVPCQQDDRLQKLQQTIEDYRNLWHESASECAALRDKSELPLSKPIRLTRQDKSKTYDVFKLHFEGKTDLEISTLLNLSRSTVWSILNR
jgi:hypothetical protein